MERTGASRSCHRADPPSVHLRGRLRFQLTEEATKKIVLAALADGLVMFGWGAISHMVTPLGEMGFQGLPNEEKVLGDLGASIPDPGLYFYPAIDMKNATEEQRAAWTEKIKTGPSGLLLYRPSGGEAMSPRQLGSELLSNVFAAWIAAIVVRSDNCSCALATTTPVQPSNA